ncbi:MAG: hypothetical protein IH586_17220 [Anaerolineaceae bacterium]|nr:hypothetical protein [Anaerolineaceae bacterium]
MPDPLTSSPVIHCHPANPVLTARDVPYQPLLVFNVGISKKPLLVPEAKYETSGGFRNHVVFPSGMILETGGEVKIYYGAADTVTCLATAHVDDLLGLCLEE